MKCIPTNNKGFKFADMVVTQVDNCHCNFNLEPYIFELANDLYDYKETFHELEVGGPTYNIMLHACRLFLLIPLEPLFLPNV
jgi:hypothetical protein